MAELPEKDKRILLGENYREVEAQALLEAGVSDVQHAREKQINSAENAKLSSYALIVVGIALLISGYFRPRDSDHLITGIIGGIFFVLGIVWRVYLSRRIASLTAANKEAYAMNGTLKTV
jgi:hypothetical protein